MSLIVTDHTLEGVMDALAHGSLYAALQNQKTVSAHL